MTQEKLKNCIGQYRELKKDLWWLNRWGVQKIKGYDFAVYYNDFARHWQFCWNDPENEHRVADVEDIFETEEEAKWHAEFGCIERTERLELPTWEEFWNSGQTIWFTGKDGGQYSLSIYNREILLNDTYIGYLDKENYTLACRKCKELFLGE